MPLVYKLLLNKYSIYCCFISLLVQSPQFPNYFQFPIHLRISRFTAVQIFLRRYRSEKKEVKKCPQKKHLWRVWSVTVPEVCLYSWHSKKRLTICIWNFPNHVLHNKHCKFSACLIKYTLHAKISYSSVVRTLRNYLKLAMCNNRTVKLCISV
jgi:hypothetical protein